VLPPRPPDLLIVDLPLLLYRHQCRGPRQNRERGPCDQFLEPKERDRVLPLHSSAQLQREQLDEDLERRDLLAVGDGLDIMRQAYDLFLATGGADRTVGLLPSPARPVAAGLVGYPPAPLQVGGEFIGRNLPSSEVAEVPGFRFRSEICEKGLGKLTLTGQVSSSKRYLHQDIGDQPVGRVSVREVALFCDVLVVLLVVPTFLRVNQFFDCFCKDRRSVDGRVCHRANQGLLKEPINSRKLVL
jgi:hypothetical protein